ncbi:MAG: Methyltransferase type 12 [Betaproteobacteria bacterium]|nr:Methyltransferase type 12 [Betaproteobacteria bacterium]
MPPLRLLDRLKQYLRRNDRTLDAAYVYAPGDSVVEDYAAFSQTPLEQVCAHIADFHRINAADWHKLEGRSFAERAAEFYEASDNFIYGILSANPQPQSVIDKLNRFNPKIVQAVKAHRGRRFFEFGGGAGVFCEIAARMGKDVYYMELPGLAFQFASWRFRKLGLHVTTLEAKAGSIRVPGRYDIVYTDAVLEHLPPALQMEATGALGAAVDDKGLLVFLVDLGGPTAEDPMHHEVDIVALHRRLADTGLDCEDGLNTFCSLWRRL